MNKMPPLPRQIATNDDPREVATVVGQLVDYLHRTPRFQLVTVESTTSTGFTLKTDMRVKGMLLVQAFEVKRPSSVVAFEALPDWRPDDDGVKIRVDTGAKLTSFTYLLIGE